MEDIFVTRQAIYDSHHEVVGYELLFHDSNDPQAGPCNDAQKSAQLIVNTFMGIGLENLVGSNRAFISLSHDFFTNEHPIPMASYQLVLEIPGSCIEDDRVYHEIKQLSSKGYTFSLYDYEYSELTAVRLDCIDIIKLEMDNYDTQGLKEQTRYYRNHGKRIQIKGIQSDAQQLLCGQLGIDYYQGELYSGIDTYKSHTASCNLEVLRALSEDVQNHPDDMTTLADMVSRDVVLSYKLLRYINCASFSERTAINSLEQAISLLGGNTLKQWALLILAAHPMGNYSGHQFRCSLRRAHMCRELALQEGNIEQGEAFLVGLLSNLGDIMETPLEEILDTLALKADIAFALLFAEGALGQLLQQVIQSENEECTDTNFS